MVLLREGVTAPAERYLTTFMGVKTTCYLACSILIFIRNTSPYEARRIPRKSSLCLHIEANLQNFFKQCNKLQNYLGSLTSARKFKLGRKRVPFNIIKEVILLGDECKGEYSVAALP